MHFFQRYIKQPFERIINTGVNPDLSIILTLTTRFLNTLALVSTAVIGLYIVFHVFMKNSVLNILIDCTYILTSLSILFFHARRKYIWAHYSTLIGYTISFVVTAMMIGSQNHIEYMLFLTGVGSALVLERKKEKFFFLIFILTCFISLKIFYLYYPLGLLNKHFSFIFPMINGSIVFIFTYYIVQNTSSQNVQLLNKLAEINANLEVKVIQRTRELQTKTRQLERSNDDLRQFSYAASHDLREPLRNLMSFAQLSIRELKSKNYSNLEEYAEYIVWATYRLDNITNDIVRYMEIEEKRKEENKIDLCELIDWVTEDLIYRYPEKPPLVVCKHNCQFVASHVLMQILFFNLLENAILYSQQSLTKIEINCKEEANHVLFIVKDNGIGISEEYQQEVFKMFKRLKNDLEHRGSGMGLAICKKIVESYDGKIWLESFENQGTTIFFTLRVDRTSFK